MPMSHFQEPWVEIAVAVLESGGQFLIGRRGPEVPLAGLWEFPGGKLRPGEPPAEAAVRECREETGLAAAVVGEYPLVEHQYEHGRLRLHFLACTPLDSRQQPRPPFRWVQRQELAAYEFPAANRVLVARLLAEAGPPETADGKK